MNSDWQRDLNMPVNSVAHRLATQLARHRMPPVPPVTGTVTVTTSAVVAAAARAVAARAAAAGTPTVDTGSVTASLSAVSVIAGTGPLVSAHRWRRPSSGSAHGSRPALVPAGHGPGSVPAGPGSVPADAVSVPAGAGSVPARAPPVTDSGTVPAR